MCSATTVDTTTTVTCESYGCESGYFFNTAGGCTACTSLNADCDVCSSDKTDGWGGWALGDATILAHCTSCGSGKTVKEAETTYALTCDACTTDNCVMCTKNEPAVCTMCDSGFYYKTADTACTGCGTIIEGCTSCMDGTTCLMCDTGKWVNTVVDTVASTTT